MKCKDELDAATLTIAPLTAKRWADFEALMGPKGAAGGCWCMLWRLSKSEFEAGTGEANRRTMQVVAAEPVPPGLLAYDGHTPVGWISVAPRTRFPRLDNSRVLARIDDEAVWSVTCFLVTRSHRRRGVATQLLESACDFVRKHNGAIVEGYPIAPDKPSYPPVFAWTGFEHAFRKAGFKTVLRRSPTRPIMRKRLDGG